MSVRLIATSEKRRGDAPRGDMRHRMAVGTTSRPSSFGSRGIVAYYHGKDERKPPMIDGLISRDSFVGQPEQTMS